MNPYLSVIIPTISKDVKELRLFLMKTKKKIEPKDEIILVDANQLASIKDLANELDVIYTTNTAKGRGPAMDAGASLAKGDILLFLHDDTDIPSEIGKKIEKACSCNPCIGGAFKKRFKQKHWYLSYLEWLSNVRSKAAHIFFGDQVIFVERQAFHQVGGYQSEPLFEDVNISQRLKKLGTLTYLEQTEVVTDGKRIKDNIFAYMATTLKLKILHALGVPPEKLFRIYYK